MARKSNWQRRGISREQAVFHQRRIDHAYAMLSRQGGMSRESWAKLIYDTPITRATNGIFDDEDVPDYLTAD